MHRVLGETDEPLTRAGFLPAYIEIMLAVGDTDEARGACAELAEIAETQENEVLRAMAGQARAAVALVEGDPQGALAALRQALGIWQELGAPYETARTRVSLALACRALRDEETAELELQAAREILVRLGGRPDVALVDVLLRRTGSTGHYGMTERELEVLRLIAAGKSNREIASALVISERTVARHIQNIFAKLGVSSRTAASAFAFSHELV